MLNRYIIERGNKEDEREILIYTDRFKSYDGVIYVWA